MKLHFIINEKAGNGLSKKTWAKLQQQLTLTYDEHYTKYQGHAVVLAQQIAQQAANVRERVCIIAIGGDGTIHEVINGVANNRSVFVGAIGAGSGMDFTRGFRSFKDAPQIELFVRNPLKHAHDYGIVKNNGEQRIFVNNCGLGFDALVANHANESNLKRRLNKIGLGKLSYVYYVVHCLFSFKPFDLCVVHKGTKKIYQDVWLATVSNQPFFGGGMNLSPTSNPTDGMLELTVVSDLSRWKLLFLFGTVFLGKHTGLKEVEQFSGDAFTFRFNAPLPCHADGEKLVLHPESLELQFSVKQHAWFLAK